MKRWLRLRLAALMQRYHDRQANAHLNQAKRHDEQAKDHHKLSSLWAMRRLTWRFKRNGK